MFSCNELVQYLIFIHMEEQQKLFHEYQCLERYLSYIQEVRDSLQKRNDKVHQCIKTFEQNQIIIKQNQQILQKLDELSQTMKKIDDDQYIQLLNIQLADALARKKNIQKRLYSNINELKGYEEYRFRTDEDVFHDRIPLPAEINSDTYRQLKYELDQAKKNMRQKEEQWKSLVQTNIDFCTNNDQATNIDIVYDKIEALENQIHSSLLEQKEKEIEMMQVETKEEKSDSLTRETIVQTILERIKERKTTIPVIDLKLRSNIHTIENVFSSMLKRDIDNDRFMMTAISLKSLEKKSPVQMTSFSAQITPLLQRKNIQHSLQQRTPEKLSLKEIEERKQKLLQTAQKAGYVYPKS